MDKRMRHNDKTVPNVFLRRADQAVIALILAVSFGALIWYWLDQTRRHGGLIDIDRASERPVTFQVDINEADWPELTMLPNIGETLARRIVDSRQSHGPFRGHDDLLRVPGIGPRTLDAIRPYLLPIADVEQLAEQ
jgi:competence protein ComEA